MSRWGTGAAHPGCLWTAGCPGIQRLLHFCAGRGAPGGGCQSPRRCPGARCAGGCSAGSCTARGGSQAVCCRVLSLLLPSSRGQSGCLLQSATLEVDWSLVQPAGAAGHLSLSASCCALLKRCSRRRRRLFSASSRLTSSPLPSMTSSVTAGLPAQAARNFKS